MKQQLVVIGNGMAGIRTVEEILKLEPELYDITVFGEEPHCNYNRILLSPVLAGEQELKDIILNDRDWYDENNITLHTGDKIVEINRIKKQVISSAGHVQSYDRLLIATGSTPFIIPIPGFYMEGVIGFRDINDVEKMQEIAQQKKQGKAIVIGGGLLGLEAANGLMKQGMDVTVVHLLDSLMEKQLDQTAAAMLKATLEDRGMHFEMNAQSTEILGDEQVAGLRLDDGRELDADLIVMAVGIRPNIGLAQRSGLHCEKGIVVNDTMQTFDPNIYAIGECVEHRGICYGLVAPLFEQAKVCANHLVNLGFGRYEGSVTSTKLKVTGIDLFSAGEFNGSKNSEDIILHDPAVGVYKKLVLKDNQIIGVQLYGEVIESSWYFKLMRAGTDISEIRDHLMFGEDNLGDSGHGGSSKVANMPDDAQICDCNGVCKGEIVQAITSKGLFTLDDVKAHTKAAASCGSCAGLVEQLLVNTLGSDYSAPELKSVCKCTDLTHDQVREKIVSKKLNNLKAIYQSLDWRSDDGCHICRPALNYYLISSWPEQAFDDPQARFINERVHGNIQKDGTFSVIPRIWGGKTTSDQLRAIADAADKFKVGELHLTGGQRINMLGVKKQDLPDMWKFLNERGLVSGHAYGKALRTVKTCVGSTWCRFGTQDSTEMGIVLERLTWGSWMPHKFKMAVSGCPRNCAEATIKDFGVVAIESGWELHIAGNGGVKVRATDLLCRVKTEAEVIEYCSAFIQLYREQARYLERTAPWVERVGLHYIKQQILENQANRKELHQRFELSQKLCQSDPWQENRAAEKAQQFASIKLITESASSS